MKLINSNQERHVPFRRQNGEIEEKKEERAYQLHYSLRLMILPLMELYRILALNFVEIRQIFGL